MLKDYGLLEDKNQELKEENEKLKEKMKGMLEEDEEEDDESDDDNESDEDDESDDDNDDDDDEKQKQEEERKKKYEKTLQFEIELIFTCGCMQPFHSDEHYKKIVQLSYLTKKIKTYEEYYQYCIKNSESSIRIEAIENQIKISKEKEEKRQEELKKEQEEEEKQEREEKEKQKKEEEDKDDEEDDEDEEEDEDDDDDESDDEEDDQYTFKKLKEGLEERGITKAKQSQIRSINQKWRECKTFDFKETKKSYMILYYDENKKQISKNIFSK